jgi:hypothetical protein
LFDVNISFKGRLRRFIFLEYLQVLQNSGLNPVTILYTRRKTFPGRDNFVENLSVIGAELVMSIIKETWVLSKADERSLR